MASERSLFPASPVTVTIDSRTRVKTSELDPDVIRKIQREFTHKNPARAKIESQLESLRKAEKQGRKVNRQLFGRLYGQAKSEPEFICTWEETGSGLSVPRGGTSRLVEALEEAGYDPDFVDNRIKGSGERGNYSLKGVEPWPFQREIVETLLPRQQGMLRAPTGSGKTIALLMLLIQTGVPALIVVWRASLLDQWIRQLQDKLGLRERDIGILQGSDRRVRPITLGMQQTLWKCVDDYTQYFGFVGIDECHRAAAHTFLNVIDKFPARYRYGVSADERRKDGKTFLLGDLFGEVEASVDKDSLIEAGIVLDVEVRIVETGFSCPWYERIPEEQRGSYFNELLDALTQDAARNDLIASLALVETKAGEQVLVFSHRVDHCRRIAADVAKEEPRVGLLLGGQDNRSEFRENVGKLLDRKLKVGIGTYQAIGTGNDLPSVARGVATTPIHNNTPFLGQVMGRLCRTSEKTGKKDAILFYLWDRRIHGLAPVRRLAHAAKNAKVQTPGGWVSAKEFLAAEKAGGAL